MFEEKAMLKAGDRVCIKNRRELIGTVVLVPGMQEYDSRPYVAADEGCTVHFDQDRFENWCFQNDLEKIDQTLKWRV